MHLVYKEKKYWNWFGVEGKVSSGPDKIFGFYSHIGFRKT